MATTSAPIRGSRKVYKIDLIKVDVDDDPAVIDKLPSGSTIETTRSIFVKIKVPIAEWLGLTALSYDDPILTGTFKGGGLNKNAKFRRKIGGFKQASYTLIADTFFAVNEQVVDLTTGVVTRPLKNLKTMTIGFPKGHSVTEVIAWIASTGKLSEIRAIRSPSGAETDVSTQTIT